MHHRDDADLGAEMTRIGGDRAQRLGRGAEKNGVDNRRLILECDCGDLGLYGEDDVEIRHRKQFGLPVGEPLGPREPLALWAMPVAAGVVGAAHQAAIRAKFRVAAERRSSARRCDGAHDTALGAAEVLGMHLAEVSPWRRKTSSATSSPVAMTAVQVGSAISSSSRSSGLCVLPIVVVATRA